MSESNTRESIPSWAALYVAVFGLVIPGALFWWLNRRYENEMAWAEGGGAIVFLFAAAITAFGEIAALVIAARKWRNLPAKVASCVAVLTLSFLMWVVVQMFRPQ
jgi:apolipoprotein N-acyltransferase